MCKLHKILETLSQGSIPSENDIGFLLNCKEDELQPLFLLAREVQHSVYGRDVYIRGLIEFTNYCKNELLLLRYPAQETAMLNGTA